MYVETDIDPIEENQKKYQNWTEQKNKPKLNSSLLVSATPWPVPDWNWFDMIETGLNQLIDTHPYLPRFQNNGTNYIPRVVLSIQKYLLLLMV